MRLEAIERLTKEEIKIVEAIRDADDMLAFRFIPNTVMNETQGILAKLLGADINEGGNRVVLINGADKASHNGRIKVSRADSGDTYNSVSFIITKEYSNGKCEVKINGDDPTMTKDEREFFTKLLIDNKNLIQYCKMHSGKEIQCANAFVKDCNDRLEGLKFTRDKKTGNKEYDIEVMEKVFLNGKDDKGGYYEVPKRYHIIENIDGNEISRKEIRKR